ncbi:MAG: Ornithine carbamoyltransferase, partial [uncultured Arthrobacter sp.]
DPTLPGRHRSQSRGAARGPRPCRRAEEGPLLARPAGGRGARAPHGGRHLRQDLHPDPDLLRGRHRRPRRLAADHRRRGIPARAQGVNHRHREGPRTHDRGRRVAHLRAGRARGDGRGVLGAGHQRPFRRLPPLPAARGSHDDPRAQGRTLRTHPGLPRRRRQQHGQLLPARRGHRRHARADRRPRRPPARRRRRRRRPGAGRGDRWLGAHHHGPGRGPPGRRRRRHRHMGLHGPGGGEGRPARAVPPLRRGRGRDGPGPARRRRPALPAGLPRLRNLGRRDRRPPVGGVGRSREPAARAEGASGLAAAHPCGGRRAGM